jgi:hypothetical protein
VFARALEWMKRWKWSDGVELSLEDAERWRWGLRVVGSREAVLRRVVLVKVAECCRSVCSVRGRGIFLYFTAVHDRGFAHK